MLTIPERSLPVASSTLVLPQAPAHSTPVCQSSAPLGLEELWQRLWRQKWLFLSVLLGVLLLAVLITWSIAPSYRAIATLQIEKEGVQVVDFGDLKAVSPDMGELDPFFRTQYEQLKSRKLAEQVIADLDLQTRLFERKEKPGAIRAAWLTLQGRLSDFKRWLLPASATTDVRKPDRVDEFLKNLYVEPIEKTHLIKVFYESPDPALSAQIVNTLVDTFIQNSISTASATDNYAQAFLERELEKARVRLKDSENALVSYAKDNEILEVNNSQATQERKLDELYSALGEAERRRIEAESQLGQARQHGNVAGVLTNPVVESLKRQLVDLEAQYQKQSRLFKPAYPDMQQLAQQIESVRSKLGREVGSLKQSLDAEFVAAKRLEGSIRSELTQYKGELTQLRDRSVEYNALKREVENNRKLYDDLMQRMSEVNVAAGANSSNMTVIDPAVAPRDKFRPRRALNLLVGLLTGLMLATGLALLRETLRSHGAFRGRASVTERLAGAGHHTASTAGG
ncbi:MAG: GumC family protein [Thiolinea sp.]